MLAASQVRGFTCRLKRSWNQPVVWVAVARNDPCKSSCFPATNLRVSPSQIHSAHVRSIQLQSVDRPALSGPAVGIMATIKPDTVWTAPPKPNTPTVTGEVD